MTKEQLYAEYAGYHCDIRNRRAHAAGIPLIVLGLLGLFSLIRLGPVDPAVVAAVAVLLYYAAIDARGAFSSGLVFALPYGSRCISLGREVLAPSSSDGASNSSVTASKATSRSSKLFGTLTKSGRSI